MRETENMTKSKTGKHLKGREINADKSIENPNKNDINEVKSTNEYLVFFFFVAKHQNDQFAAMPRQ